jgi:hypothetical protein
MFKALVPALLLLTSTAFANIQEAGYNFAAVTLGVTRPAGGNADGIPLRFGYGAEVDHAFSKDFAAGVLVLHDSGAFSSTSDINFNLTRVGAQAIYNPTHESFIDVRSGVAFRNASASVGGVNISSDTETSLFYGGGFGAIIAVMPKFQFLPALHYSHVLKTSNSVDFDVLDVGITFRYQF